MAGLYIHIPFCASRCIYCGFYSTTALALRQQYVDAVCREMVMRGERKEVRGERIETIYFGGGTPSQLTIEQLRQLFLYIKKVYNLTGGQTLCEVTIECNPDDITVEYAAALQQLPVNRVSLGVQTFDDNRLRFLHRRHTAKQVPVAIQHLRDAGIKNISIDLMYGFPNESLSNWQYDINAALALNVEHISAYCLTIEENTPLWRLKMKDERIKMPGEELERAMYELLIDKLTAAGFEHYEISNFAKPGFRSRHNSNYWHDVPYIGLGAAAHSYTPSVRSWNIANIRQYIAAIEHGDIPSEQELLDADTQYNDRVTVALRTCEGLDLDSLSVKHRHYCLHEAQCFLNDGLLRLNGNQLILTRQGLFVSDYIMSSLVFV